MAGGNMIEITQTAVNGETLEWTELSLSDDAREAIVYFLVHRDETFSYCVTCSDEPDSAHIEYMVRFGVEVKGEVNI